MLRFKMLYRLVGKAFLHRPGRLLASLAALTVGAMLSSAFLSLYFVLPAQMSGEFKTLGPNLVLAPPQEQQTFPGDLDSRLSAAQPQLMSVPWLYAVGQVQESSVVMAGTDLSRLAAIDSGWKVAAEAGSNQSVRELASIAQTPDWLLAGEKAAEQFGWKPGQQVEINYAGKPLRLRVAAVISTGGSEDSQAIVPLSSLQSLTQQPGRLSLLQVRAPGSAAQVESARRQIAALLPELDARPLLQVVESEARVVMKVRLLMYGLTAVVLGIVVLSVMTTVSGVVLDRQRDIGVMKTLGGSNWIISSLFMLESEITALASAVVGYWLGFWLAEWAAHAMFQSSLPWRPDVLASVVGATLFVALIATAIPIRAVWKLEPAAILKGN